jgi:hypothetical protein
MRHAIKYKTRVARMRAMPIFGLSVNFAGGEDTWHRTIPRDLIRQREPYS